MYENIYKCNKKKRFTMFTKGLHFCAMVVTIFPTGIETLTRNFEKFSLMNHTRDLSNSLSGASLNSCRLIKSIAAS